MKNDLWPVNCQIHKRIPGALTFLIQEHRKVIYDIQNNKKKSAYESDIFIHVCRYKHIKIKHEYRTDLLYKKQCFLSSVLCVVFYDLLFVCLSFECPLVSFICIAIHVLMVKLYCFEHNSILHSICLMHCCIYGFKHIQYS